MPSGDVVDLCDSEEDAAPPAISLQQEARAQNSYHVVGWEQQGTATAATAAPRPPLAALQTHLGSPSRATSTAKVPGDFLAGAEALRRRQEARASGKAAREAPPAAVAAAVSQDPPQPPTAEAGTAAALPQRQQYHHQEQLPSQQAAGCNRYSSGRGTPVVNPWNVPSSSQPWQQQQQQQRQTLDPQPERFDPGSDQEWYSPAGSPPDSQPRQPAAGRRRGDAARAARQRRDSGEGLSDEGPTPAKKARKPNRTREEIARDKAFKAQEKQDRKLQREAGSKNKAVQQVRLVVDASLLSSGGGRRSALGVQMLAALEDSNARLPAASADRRINHVVQALDLAPYRTLRWEQRSLVSAAAAAAEAQAPASQQLASQVPASQLSESWAQLPYIMVCFEPEEFIQEVLRDRLASLLGLLEAKAPGKQPFIMVQGLYTHINRTERASHQSDMRAGQAVQVQRSVRGLMDDFLAELAVGCPRLAFRDVVDAQQAAQHVQLVTISIATNQHKDDDSTAWLEAHDKSNTQVMTNVLINHPLPDPHTEPFMRSITALPSVKPAMAHVLATRYGSLAGFMDMLLDQTRTDADKASEIADAYQVGRSRPTRIGPAAAKQLLQLLRCEDPDVLVKAEAKDG